MAVKKNIDTKRRKTILGIVGTAGGASLLPEKWVKPVIDSVILPSHAQTSSTTTTSAPVTPAPTTTASTTTSTTTTTVAPDPVVAVLNGVVDGDIGTQFTVDASASTGPAGVMLSYMFSVDANCILMSQSGATAVIERGLIAGTCRVSVTVTDGATSDTATQTAQVIGGPPTTPPP